jgi:hypothetical protein
MGGDWVKCYIVGNPRAGAIAKKELIWFLSSKQKKLIINLVLAMMQQEKPVYDLISDVVY